MARSQLLPCPAQSVSPNLARLLSTTQGHNESIDHRLNGFPGYRRPIEQQGAVLCKPTRGGRTAIAQWRGKERHRGPRACHRPRPFVDVLLPHIASLQGDLGLLAAPVLAVNGGDVDNGGVLGHGAHLRLLSRGVVHAPVDLHWHSLSRLAFAFLRRPMSGTRESNSLPHYP